MPYCNSCQCRTCTSFRTFFSFVPRNGLQIVRGTVGSPNTRARLRCAECGGQLHSVKPWRQDDVLGKPLGAG